MQYLIIIADLRFPLEIRLVPVLPHPDVTIIFNQLYLRSPKLHIIGGPLTPPPPLRLLGWLQREYICQNWPKRYIAFYNSLLPAPVPNWGGPQFIGQECSPVTFARKREFKIPHIVAPLMTLDIRNTGHTLVRLLSVQLTFIKIIFRLFHRLVKAAA